MKNTDYTDKSKTGQAILELAIFGSILIMLLGILVNYGLRYINQQKIMQETFRDALKSAAETVKADTPQSVTHVVVRDIHIPNPADPFTVGSVQPISASASVVRNYRSDETAASEDALPIVKINIQGKEYPFKLAGLRTEYNVPEDSIEKYRQIYGGYNVEEPGDEDSACLDWQPNPNGGPDECAEYSKDIVIIDSLEGEIIDYDAAVKQCRQIVDEEAFRSECERGKQSGSETDCTAISQQVMNPPNQSNASDGGGAWYCANYTYTLNPPGSLYTYSYTFPKLDSLFVQTVMGETKAIEKMGVQPDYIETTRVDNKLERQEGSADISTTDTLDWRDETRRIIVYRPEGDTSGNAATREVKSSVSQKGTKSWKTNW